MHFCYEMNSKRFLYLFMNLQRYDNLILKLFQQRNTKINRRKVAKVIDNPNKYSNLRYWLYNRYPEAESLEETFIFLRTGKEHRPICKECGKSIPCTNRSDFNRQYCCIQCQCKQNHKKMLAATLEYHHKVKEGLIEDTRTKHMVETMNKRYGGISKMNKDRRDRIVSKGKETICNEYGVSSWSEFCKLPEIQQKTTESLLQNHPGSKTRHDVFTSKEITNKKYQTRNKNKTWNTSKPEEQLYKLLTQFYPDTIRQYYSEEYPFNCDFYIPSIKLYIEYQGLWTHGKHPYDPNNPDDIKRLNMIKDKMDNGSKYYKIAYNVWAKSDPKKRQTAKENNLNFLEIWPKWTDEQILSEVKRFEDMG